MPPDVIAFPRRQGVFLAAVLGEEPRPGRAPLLSVVAEDGARFRFPADGVIVRVPWADAPGDPDQLGPWLAALRSRCAPFTGWAALHGDLEDGARLPFTDLAAAAGCDGDDGLLALALGADAAPPWFRREEGLWRVVPIQEALTELLRHNQRRFVAAGEEAVLRWWRAGGVLPPDWPLGALAVAAARTEQARWISEPDYAPHEPTAAAFALSTVVEAALRGGAAGDPVGTELVRRMGAAEDLDRLYEQLVERGALAADVDPARHRAEMHYGGDDAAREEIDALAATPAPSADREDLTGLFTVAIDDADTREVDDAVSIVRDGDGLLLYVHIADVASCVPCGSALDLAVRDRGASLYLPGDSELMFPPPLVVDRMSLACDAARGAVTGVFRVGADGRVELDRFVRSLVRLDRRADYGATRDPAVLAADVELGAELVRIARSLLDRRLDAGARVLRVPGFKITMTPEGPQLGTRRQDTPGDLVVSETMVLTNSAAGRLLADRDVPAIFRSQGAVPGAHHPQRGRSALRAPRPPHVRADGGPGRPAAPRQHRRGRVRAVHVADAPLRRPRQPAPAARDDRRREPAARPRRARRPRPGPAAARALDPPRLGRADAAPRGRTPCRRIGETLHGILSRAPRRGLGSVWVPQLCRELPLRAEKGWRGPPVGTAADWRIAAVSPRGRIELAPA